MGVMSCSRTDCPNILCDTYVDGVGLICGECQEEFKEKIKKEGNNKFERSFFKEELIKFVNTSKEDDESSEIIHIDDFFS